MVFTSLGTLSNSGSQFASRHPLDSLIHPIKKCGEDFPGGAVAKNPPANAGDTGSSPGPGRSHMLRSN